MFSSDSAFTSNSTCKQLSSCSSDQVHKAFTKKILVSLVIMRKATTNVKQTDVLMFMYTWTTWSIEGSQTGKNKTK